MQLYRIIKFVVGLHLGTAVLKVLSRVVCRSETPDQRHLTKHKSATLMRTDARLDPGTMLIASWLDKVQ